MRPPSLSLPRPPRKATSPRPQMNSPLSGYEESRLRGRFSFRSPAANRCDTDVRLPHLMVGHFCEIDFARLARGGVHYHCLDVDNTLLPQTAEALDPAVISHLEE